ncbi:hypothetical protein BCR33DRAFT_647443, partial [Rhizoclosmatium globosum]
FYELGPRFCIHAAIPADQMHSIPLGVFGKHLWPITLKLVEGQNDGGLDVLDSRFKRIPPYPGFSRFKNSVSSLSFLTKKDYESIMMGLLPCLFGLVSSDVILCLRTLIDTFMMIKSASHTENSIGVLENNLVLLHEQLNVFRAQKSMKFPKMHILASFPRNIRRFGAADSYGTEFLESTQRLNVVEAYEGTNHKNSEEQMIRAVTRKDKVH